MRKIPLCDIESRKEHRLAEIGMGLAWWQVTYYTMPADGDRLQKRQFVVPRVAYVFTDHFGAMPDLSVLPGFWTLVEILALRGQGHDYSDSTFPQAFDQSDNWDDYVRA